MTDRRTVWIAALLVMLVSAALGLLVPLFSGGGGLGGIRAGQADAPATAWAERTATPTAAATATGTRQLPPTVTPTPSAPPAETATATPSPTATVAWTQAPTATRPPTATPAPSPTPTSLAPLAIVEADRLNVRAGPGLDFAVLGVALSGDRFTIEGRSGDGAWWQVCCMLEGQRGWVAADFVRTEGDAGSLPVAE